MGSVSVCLLKGKICRSVRFHVHVCTRLSACVFVHLYTHVCVNMCIGVCARAFLPPCVSVDLLMYVHVVYESNCVYVLGECAAVPVPALCPFLPQPRWFNRDTAERAVLPPFCFQNPLGPPKEEKERKERKPRRKKKNLTVPVGSQRQAFLHQGRNKGKSPKTGNFFWDGRGRYLPFYPVCPYKEVTLRH